MNRYQTVKPEQKYTAKMFEREFPTEDACLEYVKEKRFPGGMALCVNCKVERKHYRVSGRTSYACHACGNHIYPLAGTIFHKSTTSLRTWFSSSGSWPLPGSDLAPNRSSARLASPTKPRGA